MWPKKEFGKVHYEITIRHLEMAIISWPNQQIFIPLPFFVLGSRPTNTNTTRLVVPTYPMMLYCSYDGPSITTKQPLYEMYLHPVLCLITHLLIPVALFFHSESKSMVKLKFKKV